MGPSVREAAEALGRALGGSIEIEDPHAYKAGRTRLGDIRIEADLRYAHPRRHPNLAIRLNDRLAAWLGTALSSFVPRELITPPLPISRLPEVDEILESLRMAGARGKGIVLLDSLGLHFNIDPPSLDATTLTSYLKAFLAVEGSLRRRTARGSRRLARALPAKYPPAYVQRVLSPDYWPGFDELAEDYLAANPSRDRGLDLLPLLAYLDENRVRAALPHEKIGPRPAFHYRLPLAYLGDPGWSIIPEWQHWLAVEELASDRKGLDGIGGSAGAGLRNAAQA